MKRTLSFLAGIVSLSLAQGKELQADGLQALSDAAAESSRQIRMTPGVYQMQDDLTDEVLAGIRNRIDRVSISIPRAAAMDSRLFVRLNVVVTTP